MRTRTQIRITINIGQSAYLQHLSNTQQRPDLILTHIDLTLVHEFNGRLHFGPLHVAHNDDRMLARIVEEQRLEVGAARGQHHFVCLYRVSVAGERHIDERFVLQQLIEDAGQIGLVVVPAQAELLRRAAGGGVVCAAGWACVRFGRVMMRRRVGMMMVGGRSGGSAARFVRCGGRVLLLLMVVLMTRIRVLLMVLLMRMLLFSLLTGRPRSMGGRCGRRTGR